MLCRRLGGGNAGLLHTLALLAPGNSAAALVRVWTLFVLGLICACAFCSLTAFLLGDGGGWSWLVRTSRRSYFFRDFLLSLILRRRLSSASRRANVEQVCLCASRRLLRCPSSSPYRVHPQIDACGAPAGRPFWQTALRWVFVLLSVWARPTRRAVRQSPFLQRRSHYPRLPFITNTRTAYSIRTCVHLHTYAQICTHTAHTQGTQEHTYTQTHIHTYIHTWEHTNTHPAPNHLHNPFLFFGCRVSRLNGCKTVSKWARTKAEDKDKGLRVVVFDAKVRHFLRPERVRELDVYLYGPVYVITYTYL